MDNMVGRKAEVVMKEENNRFRMKGNAESKGTLSVEEKGEHVIVTMTAGNIKPEDPRRYRYQLMLLGLASGKSLHRTLGEIRPDSDGNVSAEFTLDPSDADGMGNPLTSFSIFMVVAVSVMNRREPFHPVLKGDWDGKWEAMRETGKTYNGYYMFYIKEKVSQLIRSKDRCIEIVPFDENWLGSKWYRVDSKTAESVDGRKGGAWQMFPAASCGAQQQIEVYGHFIFAYNDEYCFVGVPGTHTKEDHPESGDSGFTLWNRIRDSEKYGYWLMLIRRETGDIVDF